MHIAAVMAALDVWDLDHNAKHAVLVVACRADRYTSMCELSESRVAADMKVGRYAARHALERAVSAGYLTVDKSRGRVPLWRLNLCDPGNNLCDPGTPPVRSRPHTKELKDVEGSAAATPKGGGAGENPPAAAPDFAGHAHRLRLIRNGQQ